MTEQIKKKAIPYWNKTKTVIDVFYFLGFAYGVHQFMQNYESTMLALKLITKK